MQQRHSCVCTQHEYDTTHKDYTADLSNGFAVTDEDLQRAIDDTEIEEKLPNEPKTTAVAKSGSKRSEATSDEENVKNAQASLKALEMLSRGSLSEKSALAANRHTSRRLQCCARHTHQSP